ncbi:MAG: helix-turn-helix transcriptional regulator [Eubacteriales bacterium]
MTNKHLKAMASRIKEQRKQLHFTQESFSEVIDLSLSSYSKIENAYQKPSLDTLINIAKYLDVSIDYLVYGDETNEPIYKNNIELLQSIINTIDTNHVKHTTHIIERILSLKNTTQKAEDS